MTFTTKEWIFIVLAAGAVLVPSACVALPEAEVNHPSLEGLANRP